MARISTNFYRIGTKVMIVSALLVFAGLPRSPAEEAQKENLEISGRSVEKTMPAYALNLRQMVDEAKRNIANIDDEIEQAEILKRNVKREAEIRRRFKEAEKLYNQGKLREAKKEWQEILKISRHPEMKGYISKTAKAALEY